MKGLLRPVIVPSNAFSISSFRRYSSINSLPVIALKNSTIYPYGSTTQTLFPQISLTINEKEAWAFIGPTSSGKTQLFEALQGKLRCDPIDSIQYPFINRLQAAIAQGERKPLKSFWPSHLIRSVSFKSPISPAQYYSERYESYRDSEDITVRQWMFAKTEVTENKLEEVANKLGVDGLLGQSLMNLSNGQQRRIRIVKALLAEPEIILLDEPYMGLDIKSRKNLTDILSSISTSSHPRIVLALRPQDPIPDFVTHTLYLDSQRNILYSGPKTDAPKGILHPEIVEHIDPLETIRNRPGQEAKGQKLVEMKDVSVSYWGKEVLKDINWVIREDERWLLLGPNGSGKTTLLSLITGDHPKSYSNDITLFGRKRGTGESVFDLQRQIGHVSPEIHYHFPSHRTLREAVLSGFSESFAPPRTPLTRDQEDYYTEIVRYFSITPELESQSYSSLSTGQQKLILFLRALVKRPRLLVLDEPFQGMDEDLVERGKEFLDRLGEKDKGIAMVLVSHFVETEVGRGWKRAIKLSANGDVDEII